MATGGHEIGDERRDHHRGLSLGLHQLLLHARPTSRPVRAPSQGRMSQLLRRADRGYGGHPRDMPDAWWPPVGTRSAMSVAITIEV